MRALVVYKKSAYRLNVIERKNPRYLDLIKKNDPSVARLVAGHKAHEETLEEVDKACRAVGIKASFRFRGDQGLVNDVDLVLTVGGDGTLLWASRFVGSDVPVLAINSAPKDSVGHFCGAKRGSVKRALQECLDGRMKLFHLARMQASIDGEVLTRRILNDALFCHRSPAATTRFLLQSSSQTAKNKALTEYKSSGLWIGPASGSTAAQRSAGGNILPPQSRRLQYVVREPYVPFSFEPKSTQKNKGLVDATDSLRLISKVRDGRLYLDGPHRVHEVQIGQEVVFRTSDEPLRLYGYPRGMKK